MIYPVIYTRFDDQGRPCEEKPSRSMNVSLGGMRLQTSFPVSPKEALDIAMALGDSLVSFKGEVIYVVDSQNQGFEFGVSVKDIERDIRIALERFKPQPKISPDFEPDELIIKMGQILCPNCGEQIASVERIRDMVAYCKQFFGLCGCGQRFDIRVSSSGSASLSFLGKNIELIC